MEHASSIHTQIRDVIEEKAEGEILFPGDFLEVGSPEAIHMTLSRLVKEHLIIRVAKGIYVKPKNNAILGPLTPSLEEIAQAVAEKESVVIRPTGAYALNKLGLSTQVPTKVVYLTNGNPRTIRVGRGTITFKKKTPKKMAVRNETVFLVIQALEELTHKGVSPQNIIHIQEKLSHVAAVDIREDAKLASHNIARILYTIANNLESHD